MACFKTFLLWMHYKLHVDFSHILELHHGLKICYACPCKVLDGWALSGVALESRHTSYHRVSIMGF
jgi:hypothetical protein